MDYWDQEASPRPDRHGDFAYPIDSSSDVLPEADMHGDCVYPIAEAMDTQPKADSHTNENVNLHTGGGPFGHAKPGSFKGS